tara:strand:+ start:197 stop:412 length:216 start_codon:yes stop_codon:yes gene_type:complete
MKSRDIRSLTVEDRTKKLEEVRMELIKQNAQIATGTAPKSPSMVNNLKKTIAKILTINHEKKKPREVDTKT